MDVQKLQDFGRNHGLVLTEIGTRPDGAQQSATFAWGIEMEARVLVRCQKELAELLRSHGLLAGEVGRLCARIGTSAHRLNEHFGVSSANQDTPA